MQFEMFEDSAVELTEDDYAIIMYWLDESSCSVDDGMDDTIMQNMTRLRMRGFGVVQSYNIMYNTDNNPFI